METAEIEKLLRTQIRKITVEGKQRYEVRVKETKGSSQWTSLDCHEDRKDAEEQRNYILTQM